MSGVLVRTGRETTCLMYLNFLLDVNEPPTFIQLSNTIVAESESNTSFISTLSAKDPDRTNQTFTYTVLSQSFRIGGDQLYLLKPLDFERTPSFSVHLRVTDNGGLSFDNIFTITVQGLFGIRD